MYQTIITSLDQLKIAEWNFQTVLLLFLANLLFVTIFRFLFPCLLVETLSRIFPAAFTKKRIQTKVPDYKQKNHEIKYSLQSCISYSIILLILESMTRFNLANIYTNIDSPWELTYTVLSIPIALLIHDFYFFWTHKLLHTKFFYLRVHRIHHFSSNPTVWAMQSLHPVEGLLQGLCVPLLFWILPWYPVVFLVYLNLLTYFDVIAHSGYEFRNFKYIPKLISSFVTSSSYHNLHHQHPNYQFGLLTRFWDKLFKSEHESYQKIIDES